MMGQYRQWLHYREIDQQLRTQLAQLEQELTQLQEHLPQTPDEHLISDNALISALAVSLQRQATFLSAINTLTGFSTDSHPQQPSRQDDAFLDDYAPTLPQIEVPWWLRKPNGSTPDNPDNPSTNGPIERWTQRWGRQNPHAPLAPLTNQQDRQEEQA